MNRNNVNFYKDNYCCELAHPLIYKPISHIA